MNKSEVYRLVDKDGNWYQPYDGQRIYHTLGAARGQRTRLNRCTWLRDAPYHIEKATRIEWDVVE